MPSKKPLLVFLVITFSITIALSILVGAIGFGDPDRPLYTEQLTIFGAMFVPAISAIISQKFVAKKPLRDLGFRFGPLNMYWKTYLGILGVFVVNYAIVTIFFLRPDFTLQSFLTAVAPGLILPIPAYRMVLAFTALTLVGAPLFNMIPSLGEEIGWRGFLLPQLEPYGKIKAMVLSGMIWALWHTPMILLFGFYYGRQAWAGAVVHFVMVTGLGIWMGHIWFKTRSTILAAFIHSVFNANAYGIWAMVYVSTDKLLIGGASVIGAILCLVLGLWTLRRQRKFDSIPVLV